MKKQAILKIMITIVMIVGSIFMLNSTIYAENEAITSTNTNSESNTQQTKKSNNANLSNLGIRPNDFTGFKMGKTSYEVTVPEKVEQVEVYATAQNAKATITGTGTKLLEKGKNTLSVVVTAEDGTTKTYTIYVTRKGIEEENTEKVPERYSGDGLATLKIENLELSPKFDTGIYEYTVKYIGDKQKIEIEATATDPYYLVEVTGNEELQEGENTITILVSDPDGKNIATYQVMLHKTLEEEAFVKEQEKTKKQEEPKKKLIIGAIVAGIGMGVILFGVIRHRKNRIWAEEYAVPFSGTYDEEEDYEKEDEYREEDEIEMSKEQAREAYLNNYKKEKEKEGYKETQKTGRSKRHKGKRFK